MRNPLVGLEDAQTICAVNYCFDETSWSADRRGGQISMNFLGQLGDGLGDQLGGWWTGVRFIRLARIETQSG